MLEKEKDTNRNSLSFVGFAVHWALPRRAAVHWSSDLNCLDSYKEPNKLSWLQLHEPAAKRNAGQMRRIIVSSFSLCRTVFKLPIFQIVFWRVGSPQPLQICWKLSSKAQGKGKSKRAFSSISFKIVLLYSPTLSCKQHHMPIYQNITTCNRQVLVITPFWLQSECCIRRQ